MDMLLWAPKGRYRRCLVAGTILGFILVFTCTPLVNMIRRLGTRCTPVVKVSSTKHCPLVAMLKDRRVFSSLDRLRACHVVFYNRVPKCASRTILNVFRKLACQNGFKYVADTRAKNSFYLTKENVMSFAQAIVTTTEPQLVSRHVHHINFSDLNLWEPVYINVVRDPLQRALSHYFYNMYGSNSKPLDHPHERFNISLDECARTGRGACWNMNQMLPYFCGHHPACIKGGEVALKRAKRTVREKYLLVGLTEDLPAFMDTLSYLMPRFFENATNVYHSDANNLWQKYKTVKKHNITNETEDTLREHLGMEYAFYKFIRQRFYNTHNKVKKLRDSAFLQGLWGADE